jgi:hypothetical protein
MANNTTPIADSEPVATSISENIHSPEETSQNPHPLEIDLNVHFLLSFSMIVTKQPQSTENDSAYGDEMYDRTSDPRRSLLMI